MRRTYVIALAFLLVGTAGLLATYAAQRDDPVVRLTEAECAAAQKAYDDGKREKVLFDIIRDCDRSGFPIRR